MRSPVRLPIPAIKALRKLGQDINDARRRRRITLSLLSERSGISRTTLGKIEKGDSTTSIGGYAAVLFSLGMVERLSDLADPTYDITGRMIDEENLPKRVRPSKKPTRGSK